MNPSSPEAFCQERQEHFIPLSARSLDCRILTLEMASCGEGKNSLAFHSAARKAQPGKTLHTKRL